MTQLLEPKSAFPALEMDLVGGGKFDFDSVNPDNFQIVVAYRGLHCPKCKDQLKTIEGMMPDILADGHEIIAISMDSEERAKKTKADWEIEELPIAYGLEIGEAKQLGLFISDAISDKEPAHFSEPGLFVLRNDGTVYAEYIQNTPFGRPDLKDVLSGLKFIMENDYPTRGTSVV